MRGSSDSTELERHARQVDIHAFGLHVQSGPSGFIDGGSCDLSEGSLDLLQHVVSGQASPQSIVMHERDADKPRAGIDNVVKDWVYLTNSAV